jgi:hypothetical protein
MTNKIVWFNSLWKELKYGNLVGPVKNIILHANMNMCNEYFLIWWKIFRSSKIFKDCQIQVHVKVETWQNTDKIIIVALKIICDVMLQQIVDKFCASVYNSKGIVDEFISFLQSFYFCTGWTLKMISDFKLTSNFKIFLTLIHISTNMIFLKGSTEFPYFFKLHHIIMKKIIILRGYFTGILRDYI